ncbi:hypothetical protein B4U80_08552 [Leptotrombidium deliense]|uniref:Uncharacterized protein n=1 Tax=Leptotrombidium deliense TaxID=299467 RepID=A0A443SJC0_9ACAR|nr:hypothetical protein B4U80_08552 [Leptotrombidium deliense]
MRLAKNSIKKCFAVDVRPGRIVDLWVVIMKHIVLSIRTVTFGFKIKLISIKE